MLIPDLDHKSGIPLYQQVFTGIKEMIENNTLPPGTKLPATRVFADRHGVSRTVALRAYEELWCHGFIESRPGSYSIVRNKKPCIGRHQRSKKGLFDWKKLVSPGSEDVLMEMTRYLSHHYRRDTEIIDMSSMSLDPCTFPAEEFKRCINKVIYEDPGVFNYALDVGNICLRQFISKRMRSHGIDVAPEEILITNGTQSSLDLILKLFAVPGAKIGAEAPTYLLALPLMRSFQIPVITTPVDEKGWNIDHIEEIYKNDSPAFFYTVPSFQNPTGMVMSPEAREDLLTISEQYRVPIVEDAFEEEMKYLGKVPFSIKSMDKNQIVIYLGSFSKVLFPGIRLGWIAAEKEFISRAAAMKIAADLSSNSIMQAALYEFCRNGFYDLHIKRMHRIYKKRMQIALQALRDELIYEQVSWPEPLGGYSIWIKFEGLKVSEEELHNILLKHKVRVSPGSLYFIEKPKDHYVRMSISKLSEEEILEGIRRMKSALDKLYP